MEIRADPHVGRVVALDVEPVAVGEDRDAAVLVRICGWMVADLSAGRRNVEGPAHFGLEVPDEGGCLYFRAPAGNYILTWAPLF
jgi:hypothetical protein